MKILVVDDEQLAVDNLISLISEHQPNADVKSTTEPSEAVDLYYQFKPDIIYLDINMPGISGIELGKIFNGKAAVVFVTAYSEFAVQAFALSAVDYLLKPLDEQRFLESFERVTGHVVSKQNGNMDELKSLLEIMANTPKNKAGDVIAVKEVGKIRVVEIDEIQYLIGSGNYVEIYLKNGSMILHRDSMSSMENRLRHQHFLRIHRSSLVRLNFIKELHPNERGDYIVKLKNDVELPVSRANKTAVLAQFK